MSANKNRLHILVLPEDDANRQIANGFLLEFPTRQIQVLPAAGGWREVMARFTSHYAGKMNAYPARSMVLIIDLDADGDRISEARTAIPEHLAGRVFLVGVWTEPEDLKASLGPYEQIGKSLARDCLEGSGTTWSHPLLRHNEIEVSRLRECFRHLVSDQPV